VRSKRAQGIGSAAVVVLLGLLLSACSSAGQAATRPTTSTRTTDTQATTSSIAAAAPNAVRVVAIGSASSNTQTVVITGAVADAGTLAVTGPVDSVKLSKGTLQLDLSAGGAAESRLFSNIGAITDPKTCGVNGSYTAAAKVLGGTGAYAGAHGTFTLTTQEIGVFPKKPDGTCDDGTNATPIAFLSIAQGTGSLTAG
jgi:hypothetical protein